jgi:hydroxymethylpyrimidine pyrophosphatase-like HAD family hydrolase
MDDLNISHENTYAIGDSTNDLSILEYALKHYNIISQDVITNVYHQLIYLYI